MAAFDYPPVAHQRRHGPQGYERGIRADQFRLPTHGRRVQQSWYAKTARSAARGVLTKRDAVSHFIVCDCKNRNIGGRGSRVTPNRVALAFYKHAPARLL